MTKKNRRQELITAYYQNKIADIEIVLDNIANIHDVAAILRSADGFGIAKVYLYYTRYELPDLRKYGKKSSASASKWVRWTAITDFAQFIKDKTKKNYCFTKVTYQGEKSIVDYSFSQPALLILSDQNGLSPEWQEICNENVRVPSAIGPYNISVTAAITFYELFCQQGQNLKLGSELAERKKRSDR